MSEIFESIADFSKRVNLPERLIRSLVKQGQLPHMKLGKCHAKVHIEAGLEFLKLYSQQNANEIATSMPVPINISNIPMPKSKKHKGRLPDKVRLGLIEKAR
ncbi:hypothetical protein [Anaerosinus sp.]